MLTSGAFGYMADYAFLWILYLSLLVHAWCFFRCFPKKRFPKMRLVLGNSLVFFCMTGMVAMAAESYLRFVAVETDPFGLSLPARRWFILHTTLNSHGYRDKEWSTDKPPGVRRIAFLGDSFTYGWGIKDPQERFTERLQTMFNRRYQSHGREGAGTATSLPGERHATGSTTEPYGGSERVGNSQLVEVMNASKPGWDTGAQIQPMIDLIAGYDVDEIVLCYVPNDIERLLPISEDFNPILPPQPRWFNPESSCLLDHLYRRLYVPRVATVRGYHNWLAEGFTDQAIWRQHQRQLGVIMRHCREHDVTLRVVLLPFLRTAGLKYQPERLHNNLRQFFQSNDVSVVDLLPVIADDNPSDLTVNARDAHPNERAHALFAQAIWQAFFAQPTP